MITATITMTSRHGTIERHMAREPLDEYLDVLDAVDGEIEFTLRNAVKVPIAPGVYLIHGAGVPFFVGCAPDLRHRFHDELGAPSTEMLQLAMNTTSPGIMRFAWIVHDRPELLAARIAGQRLPPCNEIEISRND